MGVGLAGVVGLAVALGLALGPLEELLDAHAGGGPAVIALGLAAALAGLLLGWRLPARRLLGPLHPAARGGFAIAGGLAQWVSRPTLAVALSCERLERRFYAGVLAAGSSAMTIGRGVRAGDERGIDGLIAAIVQCVRDLGQRARTLQSGLVHRELAYAFAGIVLLLVVLAGTAIRI
jgi:NADH-quinone oxidoreductase subunit L